MILGTVGRLYFWEISPIEDVLHTPTYATFLAGSPKSINEGLAGHRRDAASSIPIIK